MFEQLPAVGYIPLPALDLRAGNLYNVVISLLVFISCAFAARAILAKGKRGVAENSFSLFLFLIGSYWLSVAVANLFAWLNLIPQLSFIVYPIKFLSVLPPIVLAYYYASEIFESKTSLRRTTFLYMIAAASYLFLTFQRDATAQVLTYWGVQWQVSETPFLFYTLGLLLPLALAAAYLMLKDLSVGVAQKKSVNYLLHFGGIIFVLLEYLQTEAPVITWQRLLLRLFYILVAFGAYLFFAGKEEEKMFIPREGITVIPQRMRVSFFAKLLFLFIFLSVIPITVSSLLMFLSFKEIIDLYIYKPLLWSLKSSREAFLLALTNVQIHAFFLMILTGLLVVVASIIVSRSIAESLRRVSRGMERVSKGDFTFKLLPDSNDEIGDVINYFNSMSGEIKKARDLLENWNRELEVKVAERTEELRILFDVSKAIGSSLDLELLIDRALERLLPILKADLYALLVPDEKGLFYARICHACEKEKIRGVAVEHGKGLLGEALKDNRILFTENLASDPRCQEEIYKSLPAKTLMVAPLHAKGKTMGVLMIGTLAQHRYSEEREVSLLATITDQLAVAMENIGVYEKEKEAVARLTELDRLKNEFISMVSHELRTPVTSADGYVSLFLSGVTGPVTEDQKKFLTIVKENNQRLLTLINRLLDFSRIETGRFTIKRELISINEIIHAVEQIVKPQLEKKEAVLKLQLEAKNVNFMGDREKMEEVFFNLIENALKFSKDDGKPVLEIRTRDVENIIEVTVADNGIGIGKEYLDKIFNKFYQIEDTMTRKVGGVGLGLAIVKEIIGNHHGKIWAESEGKGAGARFIFTLPLAEKI